MPKNNPRAAAALIFAIAAATVSAEPRHVPSQYPTIQSAIDAAQPGDEIIIAPGTYREHLNPENKSLTLIGAGPDQTILSGDLDADTTPDGPILDYQNELVDVLPFITIQSLTMTDATVGLRFYRAADIRIESVNVTRCAVACIQQRPRLTNLFVRDIIVRSSELTDSGAGILLFDTNAIEIEDCTFDNLAGTSLQAQTQSLSLIKSEFKNCAAGVNLTAEIGLVSECKFEGNVPRASSQGAGQPATALNAIGTIVIERSHFHNNGTNSSRPTLVVEGEVDILACDFDGNRGSFESAVLAYGFIDIEDCTFTRNIGRHVGPINLSASNPVNSTIVRCNFIGNGELQPDGRIFPGAGGGFCIEQGRVIVSDCYFENNLAGTAGAIMLGGLVSYCSVERSVFVANRAAGHIFTSAGAISASSGGRAIKELNVSNSIFIGNSADGGPAGAIFASPRTTITNCAFIGNVAKDGSVVYFESRSPLQPTLADTLLSNSLIVASHEGSPFASTHGLFTPSDISNLITSNIHFLRFTRPPSHGGDGFGDDPRTPLIDESLNDDFGDLTLLPGSPAIDAGANTKLPRDTYDLDRDGDTLELLVGTTDLAGNPRFIDDPASPNLHDPASLPGPIDLGPYEFVPAPLRRHLAPAAR